MKNKAIKIGIADENTNFIMAFFYKLFHPVQALLKSNLDYRDIFIFSYISYGLNMADLCLLTWDNIDSKYIEVVRKKTDYSDETHTIRILLTDEHKRYIEAHGKGDYYVFDVLKRRDSEETKHKLIKQFTHNLNDNIKRIAKQINTQEGAPIIDEKISSYFARHSFATIVQETIQSQRQ